jgi:carboxyl-terminal processing protease
MMNSLNRPFRRSTLLAFFVCALFLANNLALVRAQDQDFEFGIDPGDTQKGRAVASSYIEAMTLIEDHYAGPLDPERLNYTALSSMLETLDPHSDFFTREGFLEFRGTSQAQYSGVGALITQRGERVYIQTPFDDTPAYRAGLRYGDEIISIDGQSTEGWDSARVRNNLRGLRGTPVNVTVTRPGEAKPLTFRIVRDSVAQPSVTNLFMLKPDVGYLGFRRTFGVSSIEEVTAGVKALKARGANSIIFDLRDNPGGLVEAARGISDLFLQRGQRILSVKARSRGGVANESVLTSTNSAPDASSLVLLINGGTASAAEIVSGAIQDHDRGILVGETSFGKGLVQAVYQLPDGYGLKLTTQRYLTPSGRLIQRRYDNITPYQYLRRQSPPAAQAAASTFLTDGKRTVLGGLGIEPDVKVPAQTFTDNQYRIAGVTFSFVRQLVNGQIPGFPEYRVAPTVAFDHTLSETDYPVSDKLLQAFRRYVEANAKELGVTPAIFVNNEEYARQQLRYEILTAAYGNDIATEVLIMSDPQVVRGVAEIPNARKLAQGGAAAGSQSQK